MKQQQIERDVRSSNDITINPTTVVPYPTKELKELKKIVAYDGVVKAIYDNTGITAPTVRSVIDNGSGQYRVVSELRAFVIKFNKKTA